MINFIFRFLSVCAVLFSFEGMGSDKFSDALIKNAAKGYSSAADYVSHLAADAHLHNDTKKANTVLYIIATGRPFGFATVSTDADKGKVKAAAESAVTTLFQQKALQAGDLGNIRQQYRLYESSVPAEQNHQNEVYRIVDQKLQGLANAQAQAVGRAKQAAALAALAGVSGDWESRGVQLKAQGWTRQDCAPGEQRRGRGGHCKRQPGHHQGRDHGGKGHGGGRHQEWWKTATPQQKWDRLIQRGWKVPS